MCVSTIEKEINQQKIPHQGTTSDLQAGRLEEATKGFGRHGGPRDLHITPHCYSRLCSETQSHGNTRNMISI